MHDVSSRVHVYSLNQLPTSCAESFYRRGLIPRRLPFHLFGVDPLAIEVDITLLSFCLPLLQTLADINPLSAG